MIEAAGSAGVALGVLALRAGWGASRAPVAIGWLLIVLGLGALAARTGAWGLAFGATIAMLAAFLLLGREALATPARRASPGGARSGETLPRPRLTGLGRRTAVFLLVVPMGFAATQLLAFGAQAAARRAGWVEADATTLALLLQPTAWAVLASIQVMRAGPVAMIVPVLLCTLAGLLLWWLA
jgi:hypothetical protein